MLMGVLPGIGCPRRSRAGVEPLTALQAEARPVQYSACHMAKLLAKECRPNHRSTGSSLYLQLLKVPANVTEVELGWTADFVIHLHGEPPASATGDDATRTPGGGGQHRRRAPAPHSLPMGRWRNRSPVMTAAGLDTSAATWRELVFPNGWPRACKRRSTSAHRERLSVGFFFTDLETEAGHAIARELDGDSPFLPTILTIHYSG
jgi:hypothetical protein